jgi:alpha-glucosidase
VATLGQVVGRLGPQTVGWVALNSIGRAVTAPGERRRHAVPRPTDGRLPGRLRQVDSSNDRVRATFEAGSLELWFPAEDVAVVCWETAAPPSPYVLVGELAARPGVPVEVRRPAGEPVVRRRGAAEWAGSWTVTAGALTVEIDDRGTLRFRTADGDVVRIEGPPRRQGSGWVLPWWSPPEALVTGLGLQAAPVDRRGRRYRLWNRDPGGSWGPGDGPLYLNVPVLLSVQPTGGVLALHDTTAGLVVDLGDAASTGSAWVAAPDGPLRHVVATGRLPELMGRIGGLTGWPALPPRWALGYHHSRWGYRTQAEIEAVAAGFVAEGVPLSALHLDIDHLDGFRVLTTDRRRFPDLAGLARRLGQAGTRLVAIVDPGVKAEEGFDLYREGRERGLLCTTPDGRVAHGVVWPGRAAFPDFSDPGCREWWAQRCRSLLDAGVAGLWHDMNEPTSLAIGADPTLPLGTRHAVEGRGGDHAEVHNVYGLLMDEAGVRAARRARPGQRPFLLSRSGWAGVQRWAWHWTGDAETSWPSFAQQVAAVVALGLSGVPFVGCDIGGFSGEPDPELYLRWLQVGVFLPLCRTHSTLGVAGREPWRWPPAVRQAVVSWIRFRYRLLPLLSTLAHQAAATGLPPVRPWWWPVVDPPGGRAAPSAPGQVADAGDEPAFLVGDHLLVVPIVAAGQRQATVTLPAGRWASLWGEGGPWVGGDDGAGAARRAAGSHPSATVAAPLERPPVLVRRGSVQVLDDGWAGPGSQCRLAGDEPSPGRSPHRAPTDTAAPRAPLADAGPAVGADHGPRFLAVHCWPTDDDDRSRAAPVPGPAAAGWAWPGRPAGSDGGWATGGGVDDAGDGDGPVRHDRFELTGLVEGGQARCRWQRDGAYPPPEQVRLVVHGWTARRALADGRPVAVAGERVVSPPFGELVLEGLERVGSGTAESTG